jgi:serine protease Do
MRSANAPALLLLALLPALAGAQPGAAPQAARPPDAPPSVAPLVDEVKDSVVSVTVRERVQPGDEDTDDDDDTGSPFPFGPHGGGAQPQEQFRRGLGSGLIIDPSGLVITNNHVTEGAVKITVGLNDGRTFTGTVLGHDPQTDIALVKLEGDLKNLPHPPPMGDSDRLRVGDYVVAIGNPFGLSLTVTEGIVSAKERQIGSTSYDDFIQTDAAINPGNSGGPLFDLQGKVVGITTAIVAGGQGIGFAVPINMVKTLLPQLQRGKVLRGYVGVVIQDLTPELAHGLGLSAQKGALVASVAQGSPAAKAGVQVGDVVVGVGDEPLESAAELSRRIASSPPGGQLHLRVDRNNKMEQLALTLGTQPPRPSDKDHPVAKAPPKSPSKVGVALQDLSPQDAAELGLPPQRAVLVVRVDPGSPADEAELRPGDVLLSVGKQNLTSAKQAASLLKQVKPGAQVLLRVQRGDGAEFLSLNVPR